MTRSKKMDGTKRQILEAAAVAFSRKGFRATTIADICQLAGTNLASVNYHFGDKENLYVEAWHEAFWRALQKHPPEGAAADGAPPAERLRARIVSLLGRITDPDCCDFEIVHMEIANPTGLLTEMIRENVEPLERGLNDVIRELLGPRAAEEDVQLCAMSIRCQCMNPAIFTRRPALQAPDRPNPEPLLARMDLGLIADHIVAFGLAGIAQRRAQIESRPRPQAAPKGRAAKKP